ncbi:hypothetical protein Y032_0334g2832 [Ancylostoma ceylanicum]|uniref:Uncharacterized protein n=1 Tax=Ancylostoma ceylanicum TaxID=53326 RepID=A0A016RZT3_9BILA|nr:hypothetical protein Y032_0334g2832 [Ancylostoma ceylanicum]
MIPSVLASGGIDERSQEGTDLPAARSAVEKFFGKWGALRGDSLQSEMATDAKDIKICHIPPENPSIIDDQEAQNFPGNVHESRNR